jgi:hypothetical protein
LLPQEDATTQRKEDAMKKFSIREVETLKTTAALYFPKACQRQA